MQPDFWRKTRKKRRRAAVLSIPQDRGAKRKAVNPKLMGSAGDRLQCQPSGLATGAVDQAIVGDRSCPVGAVGTHAFSKATRQFAQRQIDAPRWRLWGADDDGPVQLFREARA